MGSGLGNDTLRGNDGDDILNGGTTTHDGNFAALDAVMAEWGRTDADYTARIEHLNGSLGGGNNGSYLLTVGSTGTVITDAAIDQLFGEADHDWFFAKTGTGADLVEDARSKPLKEADIVTTF